MNTYPCLEIRSEKSGQWRGPFITYLPPDKHDDVIKWKHFPRYWPFVRGIHRFPVNSPPKGQWRGALMFSFVCAWINGWVGNREAGDLRCHRAHFDVIVMGEPFKIIKLPLYLKWTWGVRCSSVVLSIIFLFSWFYGGNTWVSVPRWRRQMKTFPTLRTRWEGNPPVTGGFPS